LLELVECEMFICLNLLNVRCSSVRTRHLIWGRYKLFVGWSW